VRARLGFLIAFVALTATGCTGGTGGVAAKGDATHGKQLFLGAGKCAACHTLADAGSKSTVGPNLDAAFGSDFAQGFDESTIRQVVADQIKFAGNYGTTGPTMPRNLVTGEDVDDVATYVASVARLNAKPGSPAPAPTPTPTTGGGGGGGGGDELAAGKKAFLDNGCGACHTLAAAGANGKIGPDLDKLKAYAKAANMPLDEFIRESIVKPNAYVEKGFPQGVMPTTFASLPKATLDALVKFLAASAKG
jgi:mono/diheme cytochrome c family protein